MLTNANIGNSELSLPVLALSSGALSADCRGP
jgi:hypothetical protein